tara:strand:- start:117 stop:335 length:219 start_codon:yes stop_codon:yes gene_type:complete
MSEVEKYKKLVGLIAMIQDAEMYEQTLDTLVEWYGGQVPQKTYRKLREGANEVAEWIEANKGVNKDDEKPRP